MRDRLIPGATTASSKASPTRGRPGRKETGMTARAEGLEEPEQSDEGRRSTMTTQMSDAKNPKAPVRHHCDHYAGHRYPHLRRRKYGRDVVDVCIVGAG